MAKGTGGSKPNTWGESRMFVLKQLGDMEDNRREDRVENREKFKTIFDSIENINKSVAGLKTSSKIILAITMAIFIGMVTVVWKDITGS
jgi:hypothetical protein